MTDREWLARTAAELRRRAVAEPTVAQVLAEAATHTHDGGGPAVRVLGLPEAYAARIAGALTAPAPTGRSQVGDVRLEARDLGKRYGRRWVFRGVNLVARAGEAVAVVGANGTGKSTFLAVCAGFIAPDAGSVTVSGQVGLCPQDGGTMDYLTAEEHFVLLGTGRALSRARARRAGQELAATLQWNAADPVPVRHLSGGTRQKLNLVLAALGDPEILLLDEPYQGFDRGTYLDFWDQVWRWRDQGKTVLVVTHLLEQVDRVDTVLDLTSLAEVSA